MTRRVIKEDIDMTRKNQLRRSGSRLQRQGTAWATQVRQAAGVFADETRAASMTFGRDMTAASGKLAKSWSRSTRGLQRAVHKEVLDWGAMILKTRNAYIAALKQRAERVESTAQTTRDALTPESVEMKVLESARDLLEKAHEKVDERLEQVVAPAPEAAPSKPKAAKPKATKPRSVEAPLRNYDQLTAKDVVSRVQKLSPPQATAILDYERARKKRATVIRAAEQRLAAAS